MSGCLVVDSDVDGFPGFSCNLFGVLIYYFEVGDVGMGVVVGFTLDVNCTNYMAGMFFRSVLQTSLALTNVKFTATVFRTGLFVDYILFEV